ncbi:MAG TPA: hypothetical protein VMU94_04620 [Streptosporangiaceae bacterium]|nr:hypothetical protein [Streptosporangiaceae bacterium]
MTAPDITGPVRPVTVPARPVLAVAALAAATVAWAAVPMSGARAGARPALIVAAACAVFSVAQLAAALLASRPGTARRDTGVYQAPLPGFIRRAWDGVRAVPWPQGLTVAVLGLEALHPARPWHTVVLGVVVLAFLLALHLAESADGPAVLRPQLPLIAAGLGLAVVSAGAAMLPAVSSGSGWLTVIAAAAAVLAAALALPV